MLRFLRPASVAFWLGIIAVVAGATGHESGLDRLESLNRALAGELGWTADFAQEFVPVGMTMGEKARGRVWLAWPDRALFHTGEPPFQMMGLSGRTVRLIDFGDETCDERLLSDREWERIPLAAVLDPRGAEVHFIVDGQGASSITLTPMEAGGVDRVEVILGADDLPREVTILDPQGAVNRLVFSGWRPSPSPPDDLWLPNPPAGVECVVDQGALD